jgi:hypothetical protein
MRSSATWLVAVTLALAFQFTPQWAAGQFGGPPPPPPGPARDVAPIDLTSQWVSIVTEDWRFRMMTPPKNDYPGLPLTAAARTAADQWDPQADLAAGEACKAYGVGGIMRMPTRLRIAWTDASTLEINTDAGRQTRVLHFDGTAPAMTGAPTWQGISTAEWEMRRLGREQGFSGLAVNGTMKVVTKGMRAGYFRKNGVPYSENTILTEYFDLLTQHDGTVWLQVLSILEDPENFFTPVITSTNFRREDNRRAWNPEDCRVD